MDRDDISLTSIISYLVSHAARLLRCILCSVDSEALVITEHIPYPSLSGDRNMKNETCQARKNGKLVEMRVCAHITSAYLSLHGASSPNCDLGMPFVVLALDIWAANN